MILPDVMTYGEAYEAAMRITSECAAGEYFDALVERHVRLTGRSREEASCIERVNLGYYAGYFDRETRARVLRLFGAAHPYLGLDATPEEAFRAGLALATESKGRP